MREGDHAWMDVPSVSEGGYYGKLIPLVDVRSVIRALGSVVSHRDFPGMTFYPSGGAPSELPAITTCQTLTAPWGFVILSDQLDEGDTQPRP